MRVFVWDYVDDLTDSYHSGGGLVVVAESVEAAQSLAREVERASLTLPEPDAVYELSASAEPKVWVFPDSGCC